MSDLSNLFEPTRFGRLALRNRIVMAPMTRSRATADGTPTPLMAEYYGQRASAGLIVSEGIFPSFDGMGYCRTPGLATDAHAEAWRPVTEAVHARGGTIVAQLMHCGRICHPDNKPADAETVAPSAIQPKAELFTDTQGLQSLGTPRALRTDEIPGVVDEYRRATERAYAAGFDGVELHAASGYLPAQFLSTGTNTRDDAYGGSLEHRIRFPLEVLEAMAAVDGADRVGFRICPGNPFNDLSDDDPDATFTAFVGAANDMGLAYLHVIRLHQVELDNIALAKRCFDGPVIINDSFKPEAAAEAIGEGRGDAVAWARYYIGNPDLVERLRAGQPLAKFDPKKLYSPGPEGYTDYPTAEEIPA